MIWEQNTATIVMVTNLKERKEVNVREYYPHGHIYPAVMVNGGMGNSWACHTLDKHMKTGQLGKRLLHL